MTIHAFHRPGLVRPPTGTSPARPARQPGGRAWLVLLGAVLVALLVFGAMVGLTMLGGGADYAPWSP